MGKYHPHGDVALYDALVRLAQDFSLRYPLIDGQGNFGSVDGDPPAAMRYTEARMTAIAAELLADIDKQTVDFVENYDGTRQQPSVLPAKLPNLLVNGSSGIAVGMATNIPPHHLGEIVDATIALIDDPDLTNDGLCNYVNGPDFPTGATIFRRDTRRNPVNGQVEEFDAIREMYAHGRGRIVMQATVSFEETRQERMAIVVTELPFQVNKANLAEKIADLVQGKKIEGIADIRDESDRDGMRLVIECKKDAAPKKVLNNLFKHTALKLAFNMNMLALVDGQPQTLPLKQVLQHHIDWRREVVRRRTEFDLGKARDRAHILEGLKIALDNLDAVIKTIRESADVDTARANLIARFKLSEIQANAILEMQLRRLAALERKKIEDEYLATIKLIAELEDILANPAARPGDHQGRAARDQRQVRRRSPHARPGGLESRAHGRGPRGQRGRRRDRVRAAATSSVSRWRRIGARRVAARGSSARGPSKRTRSPTCSSPRRMTGPCSSRTVAACSAPRSTRCPTRAGRPRASRSSTWRASRSRPASESLPC